MLNWPSTSETESLLSGQTHSKMKLLEIV